MWVSTWCWQRQLADELGRTELTQYAFASRRTELRALQRDLETLQGESLSHELGGLIEASHPVILG